MAVLAGGAGVVEVRGVHDAADDVGSGESGDVFGFVLYLLGSFEFAVGAVVGSLGLGGVAL